jgi:hypothetical protein
MVDGTSIISRKIKSFDENISDYGLFLDSEPYKDEIFSEDRSKSKICVQCNKGHGYKPSFNGVKTSIERIPELIPLIFKEDSMKHA